MDTWGLDSLTFSFCVVLIWTLGIGSTKGSNGLSGSVSQGGLMCTANIPSANLIIDMPAVPERIGTLEERVKNHIFFFRIAVAAVFAWLAAISYLLYEMNGRVKEIAGSQRLARIERLVEESPNEALQEIASLNQEAFPQSLPALQKVADQPLSEVKPSVPTLQLTKTLLLRAPEGSPEYWPTVLKFISFMSSINQDKVPPPGEPTLTVSHNTGFPSLGTIRNQIILLDSGEIGNTRFENSRIIFRNLPVKMRSVLFINCVFEMPSNEAPSLYLRTLAKQLLAANLESVSIPSL